MLLLLIPTPDAQASPCAGPILSMHPPHHGAGMNLFRCFCLAAFAWGEETKETTPNREHHCVHFNHEGSRGSGLLGSLPRAAQESRSELLMRLLGRRKVSGRMGPGFSGLPIHQDSPLLQEQIQAKGLRLCLLASPSSELRPGYGRQFLNSHLHF